MSLDPSWTVCELCGVRIQHAEYLCGECEQRDDAGNDWPMPEDFLP